MIVLACQSEFALLDNRALRDSDHEPGAYPAALYGSLMAGVAELRLLPSRAEVPAAVARCHDQGQPCVYLSICPPNELDLSLPCPVIAAFGWAYSSLPDEAWADNPSNDWSAMLARCAGVVTFSHFSAGVVREALGEQVPVLPLPLPIGDDYRCETPEKGGRNPIRQQRIPCQQLTLDSSRIDFGRDFAAVLAESLDVDAVDGAPLEVDGVVYTAVVDPASRLTNWHDFLWAFCWAFRQEPGVTLLVLLEEGDVVDAFSKVLKALYTLDPFDCRVVAIGGPVSTDQYRALIGASTYMVSSANASAQDQALMAFMAAGVPAIVPRHTALEEIAAAGSGLHCETSLQRVEYPGDPRIVRRTFTHRIRWDSLLDRITAGYTIARQQDADTYQAMSRRACEAQAAYCGAASLAPAVEEFFEQLHRSGRIGEPLAANGRALWPRLRRLAGRMLGKVS